MIKDIIEVNFPEYATLSNAEIHRNFMGANTITSTLDIDGNIKPDFSHDWIVEFQGERYVHPLRKPQADKGNESLYSSINLTFTHWAEIELQRYLFVEMTSTDTGTAIPDKYVASMSLTLPNFTDALNRVLTYYYGDKIQAELYSGWVSSDEPQTVTIENTFIWDLLPKIFEIYGVHWQIKGDNTETDKCKLLFGFPNEEIEHIFEYGFKGGLLKVERQVQDSDIRNIILGRGSDKNLPHRYFKDADPDNPTFHADPDWIPELANIYFTELRDSAFRSYVQGWKAKRYGGTVTKSQAAVDWAWQKGYTDTKFSPVEFVADNITDNPETGDRRVEILPDYSPYVKKGSSIDEYGPKYVALDNNDKIFPTIQRVSISPYGRIDQVVAVEEITSDDIVDNAGAGPIVTELPAVWGNIGNLAKGEIGHIIITGTDFRVENGMKANLSVSPILKAAYKDTSTGEVVDDYLVLKGYSVTVTNVDTGGTVSASGITEGHYTYTIDVEVQNTLDENMKDVRAGTNAPMVTQTEVTDISKGNTWNIWVKNLWGTEKSDNETDAEYSERVWKPILGDREEDEAKVAFSTGLLSISEDYEFTIPKGVFPQYDTSMSFGGVSSYWKITLAKSDADLDVTGKLLPNTQTNAKAGDYFFFIGIDLPYLYYTEAEKRLTVYKQNYRDTVSDVKPTWVVTPDKVRIGRTYYDDTVELIKELRPGASLRLADKRFIETDETLHIQSVTYRYQVSDGDIGLIPDVEIVLSNDFEVVTDPVGTLQGDVSALEKQMGAIGSIEQIVNVVGSTLGKRFLRRDLSDSAYGQITHKKRTIQEKGVQFGNAFVPGIGGIGGMIDEDANGELRSLKLRDWLEVPELRYNKVSIYIGVRWDTFGGGIIEEITPDATGLDIGTGKLKLEDGEYGAIAVNDFFMGIWHDERDYFGNATETTDDHKGNFKFAGFKTVYFQITSVSGTNNENFTYVLRSENDGGNGIHPFAGMHFAGRGNLSDKERQSFSYSTTEYAVSLTGVNSWEFHPSNYYEIRGHIEGFSMPAIDADGNVYSKVFHGYGHVLGNAYVFGQIDQFERVAYRCFIEQSLGGIMAPGETETITVSVLNGYGEDVTTRFTHYSVTRNTGDAGADSVWNAAHESVGNPFQIAFSDLGIDGTHKTMATFNIIATDEETNETAQVQAVFN